MMEPRARIRSRLADDAAAPGPQASLATAGRALRHGAAVAAAVPLLLQMDAQWLKLDDFQMMERFRGQPVGKLVADVLFTRTTPHVRFAFVEHLLFLPFFRSWFDSRLVVNAVFAACVLLLVWGGTLVCRPLRRSPAAWLGAFAVYAATIFGATAWNTLEFKTAYYLPLAFVALAALADQSLRLASGEAPPSRGRVLGWALLGALAFHTAEITLPAVLLLGCGLASRRRAPRWLPVAIAAWPLAYWAANRVLFPRPLGVLAEGNVGVLPVALGFTLRHLAGILSTEAAFAAVLVGIAAVLAIRSRDLAELAELAAFPASALLLVFLTQVNAAGEGVPGYISERHIFTAQLLFVGGAILALGAALRRVDVRAARAVAAVALLAFAVRLLPARLAQLSYMAGVRREELAWTFAVRDALRAEVARAPAQELVVFVRAWPLGGIGRIAVDPTFLLAPWSRESFAHLEICSARGACPEISFVANVGWLQARLDPAARAALCARAGRARVLEVGDGAVLRTPDRPPSRGAACDDWLSTRHLVEFSERP